MQKCLAWFPGIDGSHSGYEALIAGVRRLIYKLAETAQVTGRHNLHAFRHRVAQSWLDSGVIPEIVSQVLGHANVAVTLTIYGYQDKQRVRKAMLQTEMAPFVDVFAQENLGG